MSTEWKVDPKLNTVVVRLGDSLEANTTYTINFGNSVKDFNEGNVYKDFTYTFSTGPYIDSLELTGNVVLAQTGKIDTTLIVMLYSNGDDSAVVNQSPRYVTKLDSKGNFRFRNLPPRRFYLYALKDENNTRRYAMQNSDNLFAFADKPVDVSGSTTPVTLYAYNIAKPTPIVSTPILTGNRTGRIGVAQDNRLKYQTNLSGNRQDLLSNFVMTFDKPLISFDSTKIRLYTDSAFTPVAAYQFQKDSTNKKVELITAWKENTNYHLILNKEFAKDSSGMQLLKTDTISFTTKKLSDYGSLKIKLRNLDQSKNPVLQIVLAETVVRSSKLTNSELTIPAFLPGEYELRILYDTNRNGIWDPGEFFKKHKQPEIVTPIDRKINVKVNWQNEYEIDATSPPVTQR